MRTMILGAGLGLLMTAGTAMAGILPTLPGATVVTKAPAVLIGRVQMQRATPAVQSIFGSAGPYAVQTTMKGGLTVGTCVLPMCGTAVMYQGRVVLRTSTPLLAMESLFEMRAEQSEPPDLVINTKVGSTTYGYIDGRYQVVQTTEPALIRILPEGDTFQMPAENE